MPGGRRISDDNMTNVRRVSGTDQVRTVHSATSKCQQEKHPPSRIEKRLLKQRSQDSIQSRDLQTATAVVNNNSAVANSNNNSSVVSPSGQVQHRFRKSPSHTAVIREKLQSEQSDIKYRPQSQSYDIRHESQHNEVRDITQSQHSDIRHQRPHSQALPSPPATPTRLDIDNKRFSAGGVLLSEVKDHHNNNINNKLLYNCPVVRSKENIATTTTAQKISNELASSRENIEIENNKTHEAISIQTTIQELALHLNSPSKQVYYQYKIMFMLF